jgi:site-specific DNA-methyltransferase (adenine-specific)
LPPRISLPLHPGYACYDTGYGKFPKLQILTIAELFAGRKPQIPFGHSSGFRKAAREASEAQSQLL